MSFELFRNRNQAGRKVHKAETIKFIEDHVSSTEVFNFKIQENIKAVLTRTHKEGVSETLLFTYVDSKYKNLSVGDYIRHHRKHYLTMLEYDHPLKKDYLKYNLIECNSIIRFDDIELHAAYFGSGRSYSANKTDNQADFNFIQENNKPVAIVQANRNIKIGTRFILAAQAYRVISIDKNSVVGIYALSLEQADLNPSVDDFENESANTVREAIKEIDSNKYQKGSIVELEINQGYVLINPPVKILSRNLDMIKFEIPYDVNKLTITTKDLDGNTQTIIKEVE